MWADRGEVPQLVDEGRSNDLPIQLPTEIWERIVEFATEIPGVYATEDHAAIAGFSRDRYGICLSNWFKDAVETKLALSRVSRYWNDLMQLFLLRHIRIKTGRQACETAAALKRLTKRAKPDNGPGKWTLRVEIALDGIHAWTEKHTKAMRTIFKNCPNIVCFSTVFSTADPYIYSCPTLIGYLSGHQGLKRLELKFDAEVLGAVVQGLGPALQVLWLYPCRRITRDRDIGRYLFPNLRVLISEALCEPYIKALTAPNLEACIIDLSFEPSLLPVMDRSRIRYLATSNVQRIASKLESLSNLKTLSMTYYELATQAIPWPTKSMIHLWLECIMIEEINGKEYTHLRINLAHLISMHMFPNLKCIRLFLPVEDRVDYSPVLPDSVRLLWLEWLRDCQLQGIRIEISQGIYQWTEDFWTAISFEELAEIL
ncbi:unnamed protein product [Cyclocybe aegerita]|uniref:Uncharacterized protein n=1 Tax=Cyclocybe aegerita TaxID=1973307 RepID=A0A8S0X964_CYCAE|nr:unnamed protein product [Cyclocybe aegerita]